MHLVGLTARSQCVITVSREALCSALTSLFSDCVVTPPGMLNWTVGIRTGEVQGESVLPLTHLLPLQEIDISLDRGERQRHRARERERARER